MLLDAETTGQSRSRCREKGSAEHLFALIGLCELIERHKKFILKRAQSSRHLRGIQSQLVLTGSDWPQLACIAIRYRTDKILRASRKVCVDLKL